MKKLLAFAASVSICFTLMAAEPLRVNDKVLQAFEQTFKNASGVVWYEYNNSFEVKFMHNSIKCNISYDKEGSILNTIRYYGEQELPLLIRAKLQKQFPGKKVFGVTEISSESMLDYYIVLEDATTWRHVKCSATGNVESYKKYRKA